MKIIAGAGLLSPAGVKGQRPLWGVGQSPTNVPTILFYAYTATSSNALTW